MGCLSGAAGWIALVEVFLSAIWLAIGIQGYQRVSNSRGRLVTAGMAWAAEVGLANYAPVGDSRPTVRVGRLGPSGLLMIWCGITLYFWIGR